MQMVGLLLFTLNPKPEEHKAKEQDRIFKYDYFVSNKKFVLQLVDILLSLRIFFPSISSVSYTSKSFYLHNYKLQSRFVSCP